MQPISFIRTTRPGLTNIQPPWRMTFLTHNTSLTSGTQHEVSMTDAKHFFYFCVSSVWNQKTSTPPQNPWRRTTPAPSTLHPVLVIQFRLKPATLSNKFMSLKVYQVLKYCTRLTIHRRYISAKIKPGSTLGQLFVFVWVLWGGWKWTQPYCLSAVGWFILNIMYTGNMHSHI